MTKLLFTILLTSISILAFAQIGKPINTEIITPKEIEVDCKAYEATMLKFIGAVMKKPNLQALDPLSVDKRLRMTYVTNDDGAPKLSFIVLGQPTENMTGKVISFDVSITIEATHIGKEKTLVETGLGNCEIEFELNDYHDLVSLTHIWSKNGKTYVRGTFTNGSFRNIEINFPCWSPDCHIEVKGTTPNQPPKPSPIRKKLKKN